MQSWTYEAQQNRKLYCSMSNLATEQHNTLDCLKNKRILYESELGLGPAAPLWMMMITPYTPSR